MNSVAMVLNNMILNYILIFSKLRFPPMGIVDAVKGNT